jgi:hypothetical protein
MDKSDDVKDTGYTYIMPKNLLKKFVSIADSESSDLRLFVWKHTVEGLSQGDQVYSYCSTSRK